MNELMNDRISTPPWNSKVKPRHILLQVFQKIKDLICKDATLLSFDTTKETVIQVNVSSNWLDVPRCKMANPSRILQNPFLKWKYAIIEWEMLAVLHGWQRFMLISMESVSSSKANTNHSRWLSWKTLQQLLQDYRECCWNCKATMLLFARYRESKSRSLIVCLDYHLVTTMTSTSTFKLYRYNSAPTSCKKHDCRQNRIQS